MPAPSATSLIDVVDDVDQPVGAISRAEAFRAGANFRTVHVLVFDSAGRLLLQRLAASRERHPLLWGSSVAGYLHAGEDYTRGARRRLREELGLATALDEVGVTAMADDGIRSSLVSSRRARTRRSLPSPRTSTRSRSTRSASSARPSTTDRPTSPLPCATCWASSSAVLAVSLASEPTRQELFDLYKVAVEEYRFQVNLNWDRAKYLLGFNPAVISVGAGGAARRRGELLVAGVFSVGLASALLSIAATYLQHGCSRTTRDRMTGLATRLDLSPPPSRRLLVPETNGSPCSIGSARCSTFSTRSWRSAASSTSSASCTCSADPGDARR